MISEHNDYLKNLQTSRKFCILHSQNIEIFSINNKLKKNAECRARNAKPPCIPPKTLCKTMSYPTSEVCTRTPLLIGEERLPIEGPLLVVNAVANFSTPNSKFLSSRLRDSTTTRKKSTPSCQHNLTPKENSTLSCQNTLTPQHHPTPSCENLTTKLKLTPRCSTLCLDLGTTTGWALLTQTNIASSGSQNFRGSRFEGGGIRFLKFTRFLDEIFTSTPLDLVFFEEVRAHLGVDAAHIYGGFLAQLTAWCEQLKISYEGVAVGTIKRHVTGRGNASKADVMQSIRQRGHEPIDDNEADALGLAYWAIDNRLGGL